jgi:short-subunit dehydrogenase
MDTDTKVVVITGAAHGLGLEMAKRCAAKNMHVIMVDKESQTLSEEVETLKTASKCQVLGIPCDVRNIDSVNQLADTIVHHFGRIDRLINNAGISGPLAPVWELHSEEIEKVMHTNVYGAMHCTNAFLPHMFKQAHRAHVINIASVYALCSGSFLSAYAMSKHALLAYSESLYLDLQRLQKPVDVSIVCPSFMNTFFLKHSESTTYQDLHVSLQEAVSYARSVKEVANLIIDAIEKKYFYILPDKEVNEYSNQRVEALVSQSFPPKHTLEKLMLKLSKRAIFEV